MLAANVSRLVKSTIRPDVETEPRTQAFPLGVCHSQYHCKR